VSVTGRDATLFAVSYRDDRQALSLQIAELERENEELKGEVAKLKEEAKRERAVEREKRRVGALKACAMCGGSLLPVAMFAGRDRTPIPLALSTVRFGDPAGGFTRSAPIKSLVCSSCGFIHNFIDIQAPEAADVTGELHVEVPKPTPGG